MALSNADRQAAYRERQRALRNGEPVPKAPSDAPAVAYERELVAIIADLEDEVRYLKAELARRPIINPPHQRPKVYLSLSFGSPRPAPKPSRSRTSASGRAG